MLQLHNLNPLIVLNLVLLMPVIGISIAFIIKRPAYYEMVGIMLGVLLCIPYLILLNILAAHLGWWVYFPSANSVFNNIPIEIILGWAFFWGGFLPFVLRRFSILTILCVALIVDLVFMPAMAMLFTLRENWLIGECVLLTVCLLPALVIYKTTVARRYVFLRAFIQSIIWGGWIVFLIPATVLYFEHQDIFSIMYFPAEKIQLFIAFISFSMLIGYAGLWEFAKVGKGTPIPFDPPQSLVTTGIYAYVRNPLQLSTLLIFIGIAVAYQSLMMLLPMIAHIIYCEGFVRWHHSIDIEKRFGQDWFEYKRNVRNWIPQIGKK